MAKSFKELAARTMTKGERDRASIRAQEMLQEMVLREIREQAAKSQQEVADHLGIRQPSLSKLENQSDMQLSTLRKIIAALGGELEVLAKFPGGTFKIDSLKKPKRSAKAARPRVAKAS